MACGADKAWPRRGYLPCYQYGTVDLYCRYAILNLPVQPIESAVGHSITADSIYPSQTRSLIVTCLIYLLFLQDTSDQ
jgi:hypothetical protein